MGSFGPKGGPPCERCHQLPSVYHSDAFGLMCHRCLQDDDNMHWASYLNRKYRTHLFIGNSIIMINVAGFILGTGLHNYCRCGDCDPNWFLHGWVCYPDWLQDRWGQPVANHPVSAYLWRICTSSLWSAIFSSQTWLTITNNKCELAQIHDVFTALHIS